MIDINSTMRIVPYPLQYASVKKGDEGFLSYEDFVVSFLQLADKDTPPETVRRLAEAADTTRSG